MQKYMVVNIADDAGGGDSSAEVRSQQSLGLWDIHTLVSAMCLEAQTFFGCLLSWSLG